MVELNLSSKFLIIVILNKRFLNIEAQRYMCLVRMFSLEESLSVMAHLHDTELAGKYKLIIELN